MRTWPVLRALGVAKATTAPRLWLPALRNAAARKDSTGAADIWLSSAYMAPAMTEAYTGGRLDLLLTLIRA
jgi:hypothetical protein